MADPYKPEPRPTGFNRPSHPHYRRDNHKRLAREEVSPLLFLGDGLGLDLPDGTHDLDIGTDGGAAGFADTAFGGLTPNTLGGSVVQLLEATSQGTVLLRTNPAATIPGTAYVTVQFVSEPAEPIRLDWNPDFSDYRVSGRVDVYNALVGRVGFTIPINLIAVPT